MSKEISDILLFGFLLIFSVAPIPAGWSMAKDLIRQRKAWVIKLVDLAFVLPLGLLLLMLAMGSALKIFYSVLKITSQ